MMYFNATHAVFVLNYFLTEIAPGDDLTCPGPGQDGGSSSVTFAKWLSESDFWFPEFIGEIL